MWNDTERKTRVEKLFSLSEGSPLVAKVGRGHEGAALEKRNFRPLPLKGPPSDDDDRNKVAKKRSIWSSWEKV